MFRNAFPLCFGGYFFGSLVTETCWRGRKKPQLMHGSGGKMEVACFRGTRAAWEAMGEGGDPTLLFVFNPGD